MRWHFPENRKAEEASVLEQALKVNEEAHEVFIAALSKEGEMRILEEAWDAVQAIEGLFRKFPLRKVLAAKVRVKIKCMRRGDYR